MKTYYRFFGAFLDVQEKFLNKKAKQGYRLVKIGKLSYSFEKCTPSEYQYVVDFIADKSSFKAKEYTDFLQDMGYKTFYKNINLNYSVGKVRWRPYAKGSGQIATNATTFNKELIIVEKKNDGKPFQLHTTADDRVSYYKKLRNMWVALIGLLAFLAVMLYYQNQELFTSQMLLIGIFFVLTAIPTLLYQYNVSKYKKFSQIEE